MLIDTLEIKLPFDLPAPMGRLDELIDQDFWTFGEADESLVERCHREGSL